MAELLKKKQVFNDSVIELGRKINKAYTSEEAADIFHELDVRIMEYREEMDKVDGALLPAHLIRASHKYHALNDFRQWILDAISDGAKENLRKQQEMEPELVGGENARF